MRRAWLEWGTLFAAGGCAQDRVASGNLATKDADFMLQDLNTETGLGLAAVGRVR
jgi:hypothetical protein